MTEMYDTGTKGTGDQSIVDELAAETGDPTVAALMRRARSAWLSAPEVSPNDALRSFLDDAAQSQPIGSQRASKQWSASAMDTLMNLIPSAGRLAFGTSLAAVAAAAAAATLGLGGFDGAESEAARSGSTTTLATTSTTNDTVTTSTTGGTSSSLPPVADQASTRITVAEAGTADVAVIDGVPVLVDVDPAPGWTVVHEVPDEPHEIDLSYRQGDERVDLDVEIDDGRVRVRIRDRRTDSEIEWFLTTAAPTSATSPAPPTSSDHRNATLDGATGTHGDDRENHDDRDNSGPGNADDREDREDREDRDNSGPGNADDREDRDDRDNSGPGNADDS